MYRALSWWRVRIGVPTWGSNVSPRGARTSRASGQRRAGSASPETSATNGLEAKLWQSADMLRNNMDAAEYKHIVLGLIFLKYISDAFEAKHAELAAAAAAGARSAGSA